MRHIFPLYLSGSILGKLFTSLVLATFALSATFSADTAQAIALSPGDIVVGSQTGGQFYMINPTSGATTLISSGGIYSNPSHLLLDNQGQILTAERTADPGIVRIDPITGNQTLIASGSLLNYPVALAFDQSNNLIVGNDNPNQLIRVNMQTGTQTLLSTLTNIWSVQDVDVDQQGQIVVLDFGVFNGGNGKIIRLNPATGQQVTVSSGGNIFNPGDLLIRPSGDYIVSNRLANGTSQILEIDPVTGAQQVVLTVPSEGWIALKDQNNIVYADFYDNLSVLSANLLTGQTQTITNFHFPQNLIGVAIYSPVPEPTTFILLGAGAISLLAFTWRRRKSGT
jgi:outer membrane protein assembly factor BamB